MKPPVESGVLRVGQATPEQVALQIRQLRDAMNRVFQVVIADVTTGAGVQTVWEDNDAFPGDAHASLTAVVILSNSSGSQYAKWERTALFFCAAGSVPVRLGSVEDRHTPIVGGGAYDLDINVSADRHLYVNVDDDGDAGLDVNAWLEVRKG